MLWLQRHSTAVLYGTYALTVILMISCVITFYYYAIIDINRPKGNISHPFYVTEYSLMLWIFFGTANAMVIFRMFSLNLITLVVHALIHMAVVACLIAHLVVFHSITLPVKTFYHSYWIQVYVMLAVYSLQCLIALDLIVFKPGKTELQREKRSGLHAFFGVVTFVVMFWNIALMLSMLCINPKHTKSADDKLSYDELLMEPSFLIVFIAIYMLLILFILLTPFFRADVKELNSTERESMIEEDLVEYQTQILPARYLYRKENESQAARRGIPHQDFMVLTASQTLIKNRYHGAPQDSRIDQMEYRLEEAWQSHSIGSQSSLEEISCHSISPPPKKCPPLKRVPKIRRRGALPKCLTNKEPEPKCGCSKPCHSANRCRSRVVSKTKSYSQTDLDTTTCHHESPKSSSAACNKHEEELSQVSLDECSLYLSPSYRDDSRGSCLEIASTSQIDICPTDYCSCSKTKTTSERDMPFGICSTTSQMDLAIERTKCSKTAPTIKDLMKHYKTLPTPPMKPVKKCMSCGKCTIPLQAEKANIKPQCSKATTKKNLKKKDLPIGKCSTSPQLKDQNVRRGRYFLAPPYKKKPQETLHCTDIQLAPDPSIEKESIVPQCEKVSTPSQTDATDRKSSYSHIALDLEEAPNRKFYAVSSASRDSSVLLKRQWLSAPANLFRLGEEDSTKNLAQPTKTDTIAVKTEFTHEKKPVKRDSLKRRSSKNREAVPCPHGIHEIKTPQRRSSLRRSTDGAIVDLSNEMAEQSLVEEKVDEGARRKNVRSSTKSTRVSLENVSAAKFTPKPYTRKFTRQPSVSDTNNTKGNTKSTPESSLKQATKSVDSNLTGAATADNSVPRNSNVEFNLNKRSLKPDAKEAQSVSNLSRKSHGSSSNSPTGSADSMIDKSIKQTK